VSVLWECTDSAGTHYSVRSHGATIRLYSNGVFHSQWNPERPFAGGIWDCLSLPALYRPVDQLQHILLLGVGGGAVIRQLDVLVPFRKLTALEIDPVHLEIARQWFGIDDSRVILHECDAIRWLHNWQGEPFDLVIDDLFGHAEGEPLRAAPLSGEWVELLLSTLTPDGLLVVNCVEGKELKQALPVFADAGVNYAQRWSQPGYANAIGVFSRQPVHGRDWSRQLEGSDLPARWQRQARSTIRRSMRGLGE